MSTTVTRQDSRYMLKRDRNSCWPAFEADGVDRIELCDSAADVAETLQKILTAVCRQGESMMEFQFVTRRQRVDG